MGSLFLFVVLASWLGSYLGPAVPSSRASYLIAVPADATAAGIGNELQSRGVIRSALVFRLFADISRDGGKLQAGVYRFSPGQSYRQILQALAAGKVYTIRVTIPEGYSVNQIAGLLATKGITKRSAFLQAALSSGGLPFLNPAPPAVHFTLEGYLFPATYQLTPGEPAAKVVATMVKRFRQAFSATDVAQAKALGLTEPQVVTLASIVQREAGAPRDYPTVAAVFWNRLKLHMPLGANATLNYGQVDKAAWLPEKALSTPSAYNTYLHTGLPPGPICSPGEAAIQAVLHPANVGYLYFLTTPNGKIIFSNTYQEQQAEELKYPPSAIKGN